MIVCFCVSNMKNEVYIFKVASHTSGLPIMSFPFACSRSMMSKFFLQINNLYNCIFTQNSPKQYFHMVFTSHFSFSVIYKESTSPVKLGWLFSEFYLEPAKLKFVQANLVGCCSSFCFQLARGYCFRRHFAFDTLSLGATSLYFNNKHFKDLKKSRFLTLMKDFIPKETSVMPIFFLLLLDHHQRWRNASLWLKNFPCRS